MATMFPCPNCGGQLVYSPSAQTLVCNSCGSKTDIASYKPDDRIAFDSITTNIYTCPTCGGEIQLIDNDGMEFCPFCGNQATMEEHFSSEGSPKYILPFLLGKRAAKNKYKKYADKISYAPDGLDSADNIDKMVGLYVPYHVFEYCANDTIEYKGTRSYSRGSYDIQDFANVSVDVDIRSMKVPFDASQTLDDTISTEIEPFPTEQMIDFNPCYLAGFYVENSTVDSDLYQDDSMEKAVDYLYDKVLKDSHGYEPNYGTDKIIRSTLFNDIKNQGVNGAYFPIYFLTTRYNDRVAYSIVNGASGEVYMDMPIEKKKMFIGGLKASGIIFVIFLVFSLIFNIGIEIKTLCGYGCLISAFIAYTGAYLANASYRKDNHLDDKGFFGNHHESSNKIKNKKNKKKSLDLGSKFLMSVYIIIAVVVFYIFSLGSLFSTIGRAGYPISFVLIIISLIIVKKGKKKVLLLGILGWVCSLFIRLIDLPNDIYYYMALLIAFVIILISIDEMVNTYNVFATRPSPQFLKKGGGLDGTKEQ